MTDQTIVARDTASNKQSGGSSQVGPNRLPQNGYSGATQTQMLADSNSLATLSMPAPKGGMRGFSLIAALGAEYKTRKDVLDIARDYYRENKKDYDFFTGTHQPSIEQTVSEVMSETTNPKYQLDLYASIGQGMAKSAILDKQWFEARRRCHRYAVGLQQKIDYDFAAKRMHAVIAGWNLGRRYEITYADAHNDRRMERKFAAANIGIGIGNIVRESLSASVQALSSAKDNLGDSIATIGNGLFARSGYQAGRENTQQRYDTVTKDQQPQRNQRG